ncbi:MAG: hypothetical protein ACSHYC_04200 [Alphaproteobacteria bacterium]
MAFNKKNSRSIEVEDQTFRWVFFENSGWNDLTVQSANGSGQKLTVRVAWDRTEGSPLPYTAITPSIVAEAIKFALTNGWNPNANGEPFKCRFENGKLLNI